MARQLFLHHYLGSLYFGILAVAQFWEFLVSKFLRNKIVSTLFTVLFFVVSGAWFVWYSPLIYGSPWTKELCEKSKFLDMDFDCNSFFETYEEYKHYIPEDARPPAEEQKPTDEEEVVTVTETEYMEVPEGEEQQGDQEPKPADDGLTSETDSDEQQNLISEKPSEPLTTDIISGNPVNQEHKVEYRDANGNILEPEEVDRLIQEGVIEVETKHETVNKFRGDDGIETKQTVRN